MKALKEVTLALCISLASLSYSQKLSWKIFVIFPLGSKRGISYPFGSKRGIYDLPTWLKDFGEVYMTSPFGSN